MSINETATLSYKNAVEDYLANRDEIMHRVNVMRSEVMTASLLAALRGAGKALKIVFWPVASVWRANAYANAVDAMNGLDDATLARIGVARDDIAEHVFGIVYGSSKPTLEAIEGGKVANPCAPAAIPERRAA